VLVQVMEGYVEAETAQREAAMLRKLHTPQGLKAAFGAAGSIDVSEVLSQVQAPTLVLHRREGRQSLDDAMQVTSGIPNAGLTLIEGSAFGWALQHPEAVLQAIDEFVGWSDKEDSSKDTAGLSPRELEVLALLAMGRSAREMGEELVLTVRTVERHISNIYRKISAHNRAQATAFALDHGLTRRP
jgi:DNA-binding CsgD family transcriptional regulator